jgi:hypothetical protein
MNGTLAEVSMVTAFSLLSVHLAGWVGLFVKVGLVSCLYIGCSLITGALTVRDIKFVVDKVRHLTKVMMAPSTRVGAKNSL